MKQEGPTATVYDVLLQGDRGLATASAALRRFLVGGEVVIGGTGLLDPSLSVHSIHFPQITDFQEKINHIPAKTRKIQLS